MEIQEREYQNIASSKTAEIVKVDLVLAKNNKPTRHPVCVCPTATGKSVMICKVIDEVLSYDPMIDVLVVSDDSEILRQNHAKIVNYFNWPEEEIGLFSAQLESRTIKKITVAGIHSIYKRADEFKDVKLIIIDECHMVNSENKGMYRKLIDDLSAIAVGFTATPYRTKQGYIYKEYKGTKNKPIFNCVSYDLSSFDNYNSLVDDGYLCDMITPKTKLKFDAEKDGVGIRAGEFDDKELYEKYGTKDITKFVVNKSIRMAKANNRKKWMFFCIDIQHCEEVKLELLKNGISCEAVHSKSKRKKSEVLDDFRIGIYDCLVSVNQLTKGVDVPEIDFIVLLKASLSPIYHVQVLGRGGRPHIDKDYCLILDFAGNTQRHGPINDIKIIEPGVKRKKGVKNIMSKDCKNCGAENSLRAKFCNACGEEFVFEKKIVQKEFEGEIRKRKNDPIGKDVRKFSVNRIRYNIHEKRGKPSSLKVTYICSGAKVFTEYVCIDHKGFARSKALSWARKRSDQNINTLSVLFRLANSGALKEPTSIFVDLNSKYKDITEYSFN